MGFRGGIFLARLVHVLLLLVIVSVESRPLTTVAEVTELHVAFLFRMFPLSATTPQEFIPDFQGTQPCAISL